jgi:hypothetical protein
MKYGFHCTDVRETYNESTNFLTIAWTKYYPNRTKSVENKETRSLDP